MEARIRIGERLFPLAFCTGLFFAVRVVLEFVLVKLAGVEPSTGAALVLVAEFLLLGVVCFSMLGGEISPLRPLLRIPTLRWVLLFLFFSLCSLVWSVTVSPFTSFAYWCGLACDVAIVLLLLRPGTCADISFSLLAGFVAGSCMLAAIAWILPAQSDLRLGDEEFFNSNQIGNLCAFAIFIAQYLARSQKRNRIPVIAFLAVTLVRSLSKTTIVAFLISEAVFLIRDRSMSRKAKGLLVTAALMTLLLFWGLFEAYYDVYTTAGNQAQTLTGRTAIWAAMYIEAIEKPWLGHGFDSVWKLIPPFGPDRFEARHAENEVLQQFYAYGLAGVAMLVGLYGSFYRQVRRLGQGQEKILLQSLLLFFVVRGLAEAEPFDLLFPLWALVIFSNLAQPDADFAPAGASAYGYPCVGVPLTVLSE